VKRQWLAAATVAGLASVFLALSLSVVAARRPLDARVSRSFDAAVAPTASAPRVIVPLGCRKRALDFYSCSAIAKKSVADAGAQLAYRLSLTDDGCWSATPVSAAAALVTVRGCVADGGR
jgi:hypothetical protein